MDDDFICDILDNGKTINLMVKELFIMLMDQNMLVNGKVERKKNSYFNYNI